MGILDDAIRQHLDLKRRQGAEEDELQRLEDEAFGPPSRPGEPDFPGSEPEGEAAESEAPGEGGFYDQSDGERAATGGDAEVEAPGTPEEAPIESLDTVEHPFDDEVTDTGEGEAIEAPLPGVEPGAGGDEPPTGPEEVVEGELTESDEGEDVLEETPEFLRDQPEDDELWFEQGEPKDFDF
jgi:hypothetical protein